MWLVPFVTSRVSDPWTIEDEKAFDSFRTLYESIAYIPSIHAKLRLIEENVYLCSIRIKDGLFQNFHLIPETRKSFYFLAYIPQLNLVHQLKEARVEPGQLPSKSLFYNLLSNYDRYCDEDGYDLDDTINISDEFLLIKVDSSITEFFDLYHLGTFTLGIREQYRKMNELYVSIIQENRLLRTNDIIKSELLKTNLKKAFSKASKKIAIRLLTLGLGDIFVDNPNNWNDIQSNNPDVDFCDNLLILSDNIFDDSSKEY